MKEQIVVVGATEEIEATSRIINVLEVTTNGAIAAN